MDTSKDNPSGSPDLPLDLSLPRTRYSIASLGGTPDLLKGHANSQSRDWSLTVSPVLHAPEQRAPAPSRLSQRAALDPYGFLGQSWQTPLQSSRLSGTVSPPSVLSRRLQSTPRAASVQSQQRLKLRGQESSADDIQCPPPPTQSSSTILPNSAQLTPPTTPRLFDAEDQQKARKEAEQKIKKRAKKNEKKEKKEKKKVEERKEKDNLEKQVQAQERTIQRLTTQLAAAKEMKNDDEREKGAKDLVIKRQAEQLTAVKTFLEEKFPHDRRPFFLDDREATPPMIEERAGWALNRADPRMDEQAEEPTDMRDDSFPEAVEQVNGEQAQAEIQQQLPPAVPLRQKNPLDLLADDYVVPTALQDTLALANALLKDSAEEPPAKRARVHVPPLSSPSPSIAYSQTSSSSGSLQHSTNNSPRRSKTNFTSKQCSVEEWEAAKEYELDLMHKYDNRVEKKIRNGVDDKALERLMRLQVARKKRHVKKMETLTGYQEKARQQTLPSPASPPTATSYPNP